MRRHCIVFSKHLLAPALNRQSRAVLGYLGFIATRDQQPATHYQISTRLSPLSQKLTQTMSSNGRPRIGIVAPLTAFPSRHHSHLRLPPYLLTLNHNKIFRAIPRRLSSLRLPGDNSSRWQLCRTAGQGERRKASSPWPAVGSGGRQPATPRLALDRCAT